MSFHKAKIEQTSSYMIVYENLIKNNVLFCQHIILKEKKEEKNIKT